MKSNVFTAYFKTNNLGFLNENVFFCIQFSTKMNFYQTHFVKTQHFVTANLMCTYQSKSYTYEIFWVYFMQESPLTFNQCQKSSLGNVILQHSTIQKH